MLNIVKTLNSSKSAQEILNSLLEKSVQLVSSGDTGLIFLFNEKKDYLEVKASYGFNSNSYEIIIRKGESITGKAFEENRSIVVNNREDILRYMSSITFYFENTSSPDKFLGRKLSDIKGAIACPIRIRDECIGVLVINNFSTMSTFTDFDKEIVEIISSQAGLAIEKARNLEKEKKKSLELDQYSKILEQEKNRYKHGMNVHMRFMDMVLNGASIDDLIEEISSLIKSDLIFIDQLDHIRSQKISINLTDENILELINLGFAMQKNNHNDRMVFKGYLITTQSIIIDSDYLGFLIIISSEEIYTEEYEITLERGITVLALEIFKNREMEMLEESFKGDFLDVLITHDNIHTINRYSYKYKVDFTKYNRLILIEANVLPSDCEHKIKDYFKDRLKRILKTTSTEAFVAYKFEMFFIILPEETILNDKLLTLMERISYIKNDTSSITNLSGIVSELFLGSINFSKVYMNCKKLLRQKNDSNSNVDWIFFSDSKAKKIILNTPESDLKAFANDVLGDLLNDPRNKEFLKTLKIYIRNSENWTKTKDDLFIHGNTLTQRLNKISDLLDCNIKSYYPRLNIQLAIEIIDLYPEYYNQN